MRESSGTRPSENQRTRRPRTRDRTEADKESREKCRLASGAASATRNKAPCGVEPRSPGASVSDRLRLPDSRITCRRRRTGKGSSGITQVAARGEPSSTTITWTGLCSCAATDSRARPILKNAASHSSSARNSKMQPASELCHLVSRRRQERRKRGTGSPGHGFRGNDWPDKILPATDRMGIRLRARPVAKLLALASMA